MRRTALVVGLVILLAGVVPRGAEGKNMNGKFGFGYQQTLLDVQGLSFSYWASPSVAIQVIVGAGFSLDEGNSNTTTLKSAVGVKYVLLGTRYANLSVGIRGDLAWRSGESMDDPAGKGANVTQWGIELPLEVEFWFSDAVAINLGTGAMFTGVPSRGALLSPGGLGGVSSPNYKGIGLGAGTLFGNAGFCFYF
jgi:hypothetical protein